MINFVHPEQTFGTDFSPVAEISLPIEVFINRGVKFFSGEDDLDAYDYAAFMVEGRGMAILQHYRNSACETTDLLLADDFKGLSNLPEVLRDLAEALDIPGPAFHWRSYGGIWVTP